MTTRLILGLLLIFAIGGPARADAGESRLRVATYNIHDAKTAEIDTGRDARLREIASVILRIRPDIILLNEIDQDEACENGQRFADNYLATGQDDLAPMRYRAFMAPSNTGVHSGHDLDNNGVCDAESGPRGYAGDCLGYGEYPGQYAMALLVREGLTIDHERVRTFRKILWKDMPAALLPPMTGDADEPRGWYSPEELEVLPLSSKSHWDVPVVLENGAVVHVLASHPTPPVFDGPEDRNGRRNHDEIRFWADYISGGGRAAYITDDRDAAGGLDPGAHFVIVGDLNADPERGDSRDRPILWLLEHERVADVDAPFSITQAAVMRRGVRETLSKDATSRFGLRIDYTLPSASLGVLGSRVYRHPIDAELESAAKRGGTGVSVDLSDINTEWTFPSDHFAVFVDLIVPAPGPEAPDDATLDFVPSDKNP